MSFRSPPRERWVTGDPKNDEAFVDRNKAAANRARVAGGQEISKEEATRRSERSQKGAETAKANGNRGKGKRRNTSWR